MKFFESLINRATLKAMQKAWAKGLTRCPSCGHSPDQPPQDTETLMRCGACGYEGLPADWGGLSRNDLRAGNADDIPATTRIVRTGTPPGECAWQIPASGKFGFFLFFGLIWTSVTAVLSGAFLLGAFQKGPSPLWFSIPFFAIFWAIGIGCLYMAVRNKYACHRITVTPDCLTLRRELLGRVKEKSLATREITSIEQKEFYQQNYQPVYGIEIRGRGGKLRFGSSLGSAERAWLTADIQRAVFGEKPSVKRVPVPASATPMPVAADRHPAFSFPFPPATVGLWVLGLVFLLGGIGVILFGIWDGDGVGTRGTRRMDWLELGLHLIFRAARVIPVRVGLVLASVGATLFIKTRPWGRKELFLEGNDSQIAIRGYRQGRMLNEQAFPRDTVREVRATENGRVNETFYKRIDLIVGNRAIRLTRWTAGKTADAWVAEVNRAIGVPFLAGGGA